MAETHRPGVDLMTGNTPLPRSIWIVHAGSVILLATAVVFLLLGYRSVTTWLNLSAALCLGYTSWWGLQKPESAIAEPAMTIRARVALGTAVYFAMLAGFLVATGGRQRSGGAAGQVGNQLTTCRCSPHSVPATRGTATPWRVATLA